jgi:hypothetical protein
LERKIIKKTNNVEISKMIYLENAELLITGSWDSNIKIYDCHDEPAILQILSGGHAESEITALCYSEH